MAENDSAPISPAPQNEDHKSALEQLEQTVKRAKEYLKVIEGTNKKAVDADGRLIELLAKAGEAQMKADNEALRASHAKGLVEEHSGAAAKLKGSMESDTAVIAKKRAEIETIVQSFANLRSTSEADATAIASARKTADEAAKSVTETSGKAAAVQANISETKKSIEDLALSVREGTKAITADLAQISAAKETSTAHVAAMQKATTTCNELQERSKTALTAIETLEKNAKAKAEMVSDLTEKSLTLEKKVEEYEGNLAALQSEFAAMKDKIEGLLPGATSAGLASSFSTLRKRHEEARKWWMKVLFACIGSLLIIAYFDGGLSGLQEWDAIRRHFVQRLPWIVPPIWLAIVAGRQYMMAVQMEEEYANKEAVSTSFEGYKRELASNPEALQALCNRVLEIFARRPGRIYEGKQQDVTPLTPAVEAVQKLIPATVEAVMAKIKGVPAGGA
ncbi:MAG: hypothetical protein HYV14_13695 [Elusimicrobia bacterium]|nr:hypothetical protein [Elusimicrobiota bacterium]